MDVGGSGLRTADVGLRSDLLSVVEFPVLGASGSSGRKVVDSVSADMRGSANSGLRSGSVEAGLGAVASCSGLGSDGLGSAAPVVLGSKDLAVGSVLCSKVLGSTDLAVGSVSAGLRGSAISGLRSGSVEASCSGLGSDGLGLAAPVVLGSKDLAVGTAQVLSGSTVLCSPEVSATAISAAGLGLNVVGSKVAGSGGSATQALLSPSGTVTGGLPTVLSGSAGAVNQSFAAVPKKSWISVASKASLTKFDYAVSDVNGKAVVDVPDEALEGTPLWEDFLIGSFASTAPHIAKIHVIVNKIWTLGDKSIKIDAFRINDTTVKFRI